MSTETATAEMTRATALQVLRERRDWLAARVRAKQSVGWETTYDERERDALSTILTLAETEAEK